MPSFPKRSSSFPQRLGRRIRVLREQRGLTQAQLGERMKPHVEPETIGRYERATRMPPVDQLDRVARALGTTVEQLLRGVVDDLGDVDPHVLAVAEIVKSLPEPKRKQLVAIVRLVAEAIRPRRG